MINFKKIIGLIATAIMAVSVCGISAYADDFSFDMQKAKPTYGGGQAYMTFTRLDNEKRDKNNFNPLWITKDSKIEVEYSTDGEYEESPIYFVFQSWTGEIVSSQEDKWVQIAPTSFDDTKAVWDYTTLTNAYGTNFSDVYAFVITDGDTNALTVKSLTITNVKIAKDDISTVTGGTVITDEPIEVAETSVSESPDAATAESVTDTAKITETVDTTSKISTEANNATVGTDNETSQSEMNWYLIGLIISGILIILLIIILVRNAIKAKTKGWR